MSARICDFNARLGHRVEPSKSHKATVSPLHAIVFTLMNMFTHSRSEVPCETQRK